MSRADSRVSRVLVWGAGLLQVLAQHRYAGLFAELRRMSEAGERNALRMLGLMLFHGADARMDRKEGLRWLRLAAADGCEISKRFLVKLGSM